MRVKGLRQKKCPLSKNGIRSTGLKGSTLKWFDTSVRMYHQSNVDIISQIRRSCQRKIFAPKTYKWGMPEVLVRLTFGRI